MKPIAVTTYTVKSLRLLEWPYTWFEDEEPCWVVDTAIDAPSEFLGVLDLMCEAVSECMWCDNRVGRDQVGVSTTSTSWIPCVLVQRDNDRVVAECLDCAPTP